MILKANICEGEKNVLRIALRSKKYMFFTFVQAYITKEIIIRTERLKKEHRTNSVPDLSEYGKGN